MVVLEKKYTQIDCDKIRFDKKSEYKKTKMDYRTYVMCECATRRTVVIIWARARNTAHSWHIAICTLHLAHLVDIVTKYEQTKMMR